MFDPGSGIRDQRWKNSDPRSGINIPDPQYWLYIHNLCLGSGGQAEHTAPQQREHSTQIRSEGIGCSQW